MITIVDYQMGNLHSVQKAVERVGHSARVTSDPKQVATAEKLILPGVGGFGDAMDELKRRDLVEPIRDFIASGQPFLGICLGLQLLFDVSYEGGTHQGLGILPGEVVRFQCPAPLKVPHMGWNQVKVIHRPPIVDEDCDGDFFYFVHSYFVVPADRSVVALETEHGGPFCAMAWKDNVFAVQFHPEKSQSSGLRLLANFAALSQTANA